jgi:hypothetical protein
MQGPNIDVFMCAYYTFDPIFVIYNIWHKLIVKLVFEAIIILLTLERM